MKNKINSFISLFKILFFDDGIIKYLFGVSIGIAFSMAAILGNIGIMDGYEKTLRYGLNKNAGDIYITSRNGFFTFSDYSESLDDLKILNRAKVIKTEGFIIKGKNAKGVLVNGIESFDFENVTDLKARVKDNEIIIGYKLLEELNLKIGDKIILSLGSGNKAINSLPSLNNFIIKGSINLGIYEKDSRYIFVDLKHLQNLMGLKNKINLVYLNVPRDFIKDNKIESIESFMLDLNDEIGFDFKIYPYWSENENLLAAVKSEKLTLNIILQIIVLVALFNVLAIITYINDKKAKEIFLVRALGVNAKTISFLWFSLMMLIWSVSCVISVVFIKFFNWCLINLSIFKVPAEVYTLGELSLYITTNSYLLVFLLTLFWLLTISIYSILKIKKQSLLHGLRQEFS